MTQLHPQRIIPWVFFICGLLILTLTTWPLPVEHSQWSAVSLSDPEMKYTFELEWPRALRVGEGGTAVLTAGQIDLGASSANGMLEARLEFPGLIIKPNGSITQPPGSEENPLEYRWSITAFQPGSVSGTLWISLVAQNADGIKQRDALVAKTLVVHATSIFGIPAILVRWVAGVLIVITLVMLIFSKPQPSKVDGVE